FEPDPRLLAVLQENVDTFELQDVVVRGQAVWDASTTLDFFPEGSYAGRLAGPQPGVTPIRVQTQRLRECLDQQVDLLKLDVEGSAPAVLLACADRLELARNVFVEYLSFAHEPQSLSTVVSILQGAGFRLHVQSPSTTKQPFVERDCHYDMDLQLNIF